MCLKIGNGISNYLVLNLLVSYLLKFENRCSVVICSGTVHVVCFSVDTTWYCVLGRIWKQNLLGLFVACFIDSCRFRLDETKVSKVKVDLLLAEFIVE